MYAPLVQSPEELWSSAVQCKSMQTPRSVECVCVSAGDDGGYQDCVDDGWQDWDL